MSAPRPSEAGTASSHENAERSGHAGAEEAELRLAGANILVVDDDAMLRESLTLLLRLHGAAVLAVGGSEQALAPISPGAGAPEVAIVDLGLRGRLNGIELLTGLRVRHAGLGCILLTGNTDPSVRRAADAIGAALLLKPVRVPRLLSAIESVRSPRTGVTAPRPDPDRA